MAYVLLSIDNARVLGVLCVPSERHSAYLCERVLSQSRGAGGRVVQRTLVVGIIVSGVLRCHVVHLDVRFALSRQQPRDGERVAGRSVLLLKVVVVVMVRTESEVRVASADHRH